VIKKISFVLLLTFLFPACGFHTQIQDAQNVYRKLKENTSETPPEYYSHVKPASYSPDSSSEGGSSHLGNQATESDTKDSHEHKTQYVLIGTLAGLALVAGIVIPIVVLKK